MADESQQQAPTDRTPPGGHPHHHRGRRIALIAVTALLGVVALAVVAVLVVTNTDWGREQLRRRVVAILNDTAHGTVRVGRISGNLLKGITLHDVAITDSANAPFLALDSVTTRYGIRSFISKKIELTDLTVWRPILVLDRPPGGEWNYARIFPSDTTQTAKDSTTLAFGEWIVLHDVKVRNGDVTVRIPWAPDTSLAGAARDSVIRVTLDTTTVLPRQRVVQVAGGYQQVQRFHQLTAVFPLLQLAKPNERARRVEIDSLAVAAYPFRRPGAQVQQARGLVLIDADSLWFRDLAAQLPNSRATLTGTYGLNTSDLMIAGRAAPADLHDVRFLYPALPDTGTATTDFRVALLGNGGFALRFSGLDLRSEQTTMQGDLGISFLPDLRIDTTNVRFSGLTTGLLAQLVPAAVSPYRGTLGGRVSADGDLAELTLDADVTFDEVRTGRSRVVATGSVGAESTVVSARQLRLRFLPVQVALARQYMATLPVGGTITGSAIVQGATDRRLDVTGIDLTHLDRGATSRVGGRASVALGGASSAGRGAGDRRAPSRDELRRDATSPAPRREQDRPRVATATRSGARPNPWFDVDLDARPLSLVTVGRFAPALGLRGTARGPIRARGTMESFSVNSALALTDGGRVSVAGTLGLGVVPTYDLRTTMALFNANAVVAKAPSTSITARATVAGRGSDPATMVARLSADVSTSRIDTVAIDSSRARLRIANAMLSVDTLAVRAPGTQVDVEGIFGLDSLHTGELAYRVNVDSISALARYIPRLQGKVEPRPAILAERLAQARADSARVSQRNAVRIAVGERPAPPTVVVDTPLTIAKDSLAGSARAEGTLRGNIDRFDAKGNASAENLIALGNAVRRLRLAYAGTAIRSSEQSFAAAAVADSLLLSGFALDSIDVRTTYREPGGNLQLAVFQRQASDLAVRADFGIYPDRKELLLGRLALRFDSTLWAAPHASAVRWGQPGLEIDNVELTNALGGRIYASGRLPTGGTADLRVQVSDFQVADIAGLLQSDVPVRALVDLDAQVRGPLTAPIITATAALDSATYRGTVLPDVRAAIDYADQRLGARAEARGSLRATLATAQGARVAQTLPDTGRTLAIVTASVPINLALEGVDSTQKRLADDAPLVAELRADSLPLDLASRFTDALADVRGLARGTGAVSGTIKNPTYTGKIALVDAGFRVTAAGITMKDVNGSLTLRGDSVVIDSIAGRSDGRIAIAGGVGIKNPAEPSFDVRVSVADATILDNEIGRIKANAQIAAYGPYTGLFVSGGARVLGGVLYIPESDNKTVIGAGDPTVFAVIDTARLTDSDLIPAENPLLANLRTDISLGVDRDTWVRSREANVEFYSDGDLRVRVERAKSAIVLDGIVNTDRGQYTFLGKRFQVKSGSATFIGTQELDPNLQVVAEYEVPQGRPPLTIKILIGGTVLAPRISLQSDAQPPIAQSDLLSYLAFGNNTGALLSLGSGSSVSGSTSGGGLVGTTAAFAQKQLIGVALGAAVDQLESKAGRSLGADVFNITPVPGLPDELAGNFGGGLQQFVRGTQIEFGKYFNRQLYVAVQATPLFFESAPYVPGFVAQYRFSRFSGLSIESTYQPRYFLPPPSLTADQNISPRNALGVFLIRNWRF